mgnify:CR=1 FL=1
MEMKSVKVMVATNGTQLANFYSLLEKFIVLAFLISSISLGDMAFPRVSTVRDTDDILEEYPVYLQYVAEIGKRTDAPNTTRLLQIYSKLQKRSPENAARFLKGLRFEMIQKAELIGLSSQSLSTSNPKMRSWVGRFMKEWVREADEQLFRTYSNAIASSRD